MLRGIFLCKERLETSWWKDYVMRCNCFCTSKSVLWLRVSIQHMEKVRMLELASKLASSAASAFRTSVCTAKPNSKMDIIFTTWQPLLWTLRNCEGLGFLLL